jgi:hypothetical protein
MKLFELYQQNTLQGTNNLKRISEAVDNKTAAVITVGNTQVKLGINSARYVLGLYETAVQNGTSEQFLEGLANLNPTMVMENDNTMRHIVSKFKHEVKNFIAGQELSDDLYHALYDYYSDHGEMPYGTMKGRDGDPYEWVHMRFDQDVHDYTGSNDVDVPALPAANMPMMPRQESMYESKKTKMKEGWAEMQAMVQANAEKEKREKGTGKFDKKSTGTGTVYSRKYDADTGQSIEPKKGADGKAPVQRSKGRPSAAIQSSETGEQISDYKLWYHKSKRKHPERKIVGSNASAIAVVPNGEDYMVVSKWEDGAGILLDNPSEILSLEDLKAFKSAKGRPKKIREWIETLRFVSEGWDEMTKDVKSKSSGTGKFDKKQTDKGTQYTRKSSTFVGGSGDDSEEHSVNVPDKKIPDENERTYKVR